MKFFTLAIFLCLPLGLALCQTQEKEIESRLFNLHLKKPNMELKNSLQNRTYKDESSLILRNALDGSATFWGTKSANVRDFAFTRSFLGIKNPWFGREVYDTKDAAFWSKSLLNTKKNVPVRRAQIFDFYEASKQANFGSPIVPTREFIARGAAQGAVSQITDKIKNDMTIDEVRELLNKPR